MISKEQNEKIVEETKKLVNLFLETNASDIDLSTMTGISSSTVGRRLTNKEYIMQAFPNNGEELFEKIKEKRKDNSRKGKILGGQTSLLNHGYAKDEDGKFTSSTKLRLDAIYSDPKNQERFLLHLALTFRLHLDTLSALFNIEEKELYERMMKVGSGVFESLLFLFNNDCKDQAIAKERVLNYYRELLNAIRKKDVEEKRRLINLVSDVAVLEFKKNRIEGKRISDAEIKALVNYQLKYALTTIQLTRIFNINRRNYQQRIYILFETEPELKADYEYLADTHWYYSRNNKR